RARSSATSRTTAPSPRLCARERLLLYLVELGLIDRALVEELLGLGDLGRRTTACGDVAHIRVELRLRRFLILHVALRHALSLRAQVDQDTDERQEDAEHDPAGLGPAGDVVASEEVGEDRDQKPEPDHPAEEDEDRPKDVQERVVTCKDHSRSSSSRVS